MGAPVYATREQVKSAFDSVETARNNRAIDRHIRAASRRAEKLTLRKFYPTLGTRTFDWPAELDTPASWRLWLDDNEMCAAPTVVTVAGVVVPIGNVLARPDTGPPFDHLELDRSSSTAFSSGATAQRSIAALSTYGYRLDEITGPDLAANIDASTRTVTVGATAEIGVGSLIRIGDERMNVIRRSMLTTGQTLQVVMPAEQSATSVAVTNGTAFIEDEVIMLDSEKMLVVEIAGNTLVVKRSWDGSVLASHNGSTIYAPRSLTVERAQCGTAAASHTAGDDVLVFEFPSPINQYTIADAAVSFLQDTAGWSRTVGAGDNEREAAGSALAALRKDVKRGFYRVRDR